MQGKVIPMGSKAVTIYYLAIGALVLSFVAIIAGILISVSHLPPCTSLSKNICGVNDWSIAGLAATILGVAATLLAILGAFAVAAWWRELNERVKQQVDTHMQEGINQITEEQKQKLEQQAEYLLEEQKRRFDELFDEIRKEIDKGKEFSEQVDGRLQARTKIFLLSTMMLHDPWNLEGWANEIKHLDNALDHEIAVRMALAYLKIVDGFQVDSAKQAESLKKKEISEEFITPLEFWNSARKWRGELGNDLSSGTVVDARIRKLEPFIDAWKQANHPSS